MTTLPCGAILETGPNAAGAITALLVAAYRAMPVPQAGAGAGETKRESAPASAPASGAGNHGLVNRGGDVPAPFLLGKPAGVAAPAGREGRR